MSLRHSLLALIVIAIFGIGFSITKIGISQFPHFLLLFMRFALVAAILLPLVGRPRPDQWLGVAGVSVTMGSLHFTMMLAGLQQVDASTASIAAQLQVPFAAMLSAIFLNDPLGWRRGLGMALAFAGIVLIAGEPQAIGSLFHLGLVIAAACAWATGHIQVKKLGEIDPLVLNGWMSVFAAPQFLLLTLLFETGQIEAMQNADWRGWGAVFYIVVAIVIVGYGIWYWLLQRNSVNQTMPYTLLIPVFGVLAGALMLGEQITLGVVLGGVIVVAGVGIIVVRRPAISREPTR